jgi:hypothetical protein
MDNGLETAIEEMLAAASAPLKISTLLVWVHTHLMDTPFSYTQFSVALSELEKQGKVAADERGYRLREKSEISLHELGL